MNKGFSLPIILILLVIIGVLIYFFGWTVLIYVAGAVILITAGTAIYDKLFHNRNCVECNKVKEILSKEMKVDKDIITTKHEKKFDTYMEIRANLGMDRSILVSIDYGGGNFRVIED